eukprot:6402013-Alexandrium_andersonii.AAC.1
MDAEPPAACVGKRGDGGGRARCSPPLWSGGRAPPTMAGRQGRCVGSPAARRKAARSRIAAARVGASREQGGPSLPG